MGDHYLLPHHQKLIDDSQIDKKFADARGYFSVEDPAILRALGFEEHQCRTPCLVIPHFNIDGELMMHSIRPDNPRTGTDGKIIKYDRPPGVRNFLDVNPAMPAGWLTDITRILLFSEGARKIDSALSEGHACIGLQGVWGFRTRINGSTIVLPDFRRMQLNNKVILVGYDSDALTKLQVYQAQLEFGAMLEHLYPGCSVGYFFYDPLPPGFDKVGLDDWRQAGNTIQQLIDSAISTPVQPPDLDQRHDKFDFYAVGEANKYIHVPTGKLWQGETVDKQVAPVKVPEGEMKPTKWLSEHRNVQQMTWAPGEEQIIRGKYPTGGGWQENEDARLFNEYKAPKLGNGDAKQAKRWLEHMERLYPNDVDHILAWFAHRTQRPEEKVNHALLFGGQQGVGKDSIVEPLRYAVGTGNFTEATPARLMESFKPFLQAVVLRISELRDMGETNRWGFYEHMKMYTASPPMFIEVNRKNQPEITIPNCVSILYTTNSRTDGLYLPMDDRRHYVMWTDITKESYGSNDEISDYFTSLYYWYEKEGGYDHVAAFLRGWDISEFDAKAPPKKTDAWWQIVSLNMANESSEIASALEDMGWPIIATMEQVIASSRKPSTSSFEDRLRGSTSSLEDWAADRKNWKAIPKRFEEAGYVRVLNRDSTDGRWKIGGKNINVFAKMDSSRAEQMRAIADLQNRMNGHGPCSP